MEFRNHRLENGLEIIAETNDDAHSMSVAFIVRTGSRYESDDVAGVSHFLEHMCFKGTPRRSAILPADGKWLPEGDADVIGRCARIGVCLRMKHEPFRGNPGVACQSAPAKFKVALFLPTPRKTESIPSGAPRPWRRSCSKSTRSAGPERRSCCGAGRR